MVIERMNGAKPNSLPHLRLIVVEHTSRWPQASTLPGSPGDQTLVVGQQDGESPINLARRVLRTLAGTSMLERSVGRAVLFIAPRLDDESTTARHVMARALLHGVRSAGALAELVLIVDGGTDPELRHAIMSLVDVLVVAPGATSIPIRVRFEECDGPSDVPVRESGFRFLAVRSPTGSDRH